MIPLAYPCTCNSYNCTCNSNTQDLLIEYLERNIGDDGVVWIDLLAANQHAVDAGNMTEVEKLPLVIEFLGQTYVMPGTLERLWVSGYTHHTDGSRLRQFLIFQPPVHF